MKFLLTTLFVLTLLSSLYFSTSATYAQSPGSLTDRVKTSTSLSTPQGAFAAIGPTLSVAFTLSIIGGAITAFVFLIIGAYQYISAQGGDGAAQGRQRMLWAGIGLIMLASVYLVIIVFNSILPTAPTNAPTGACPAGQMDVGGGQCG